MVSRLTRPIWLLAAALALLAQGARAQRASLGPLTYEEGAPLQRLAYTSMSESADPVPEGHWGMDVWLGYSNIFEQDSSATHWLFLDMERLTAATTLRFGFTERLEIGGRLTLESTGGGVLDGFIVWWHEKLSLGNANRTRYPSDSYGQRLEGAGDEVLLDVGPRTLALEDVRLFAKWLALRSEDGRGALSLRAAARVPVRENRVGGERADFALTAIGRVPAGAWFLHGSATVTTVRAAPELAPVLRSRTGYFMVGVERPLGSSLAALAQYSVGTPLLTGFHDKELDRAFGNLVFGLAGRVGTSWRWEASFQEDVPADTPAIDFTLGLRLSRYW